MGRFRDSVKYLKFWQQALAEFIGSFFFLFISIGTILSTDVNNPMNGDFESLYADRQLTIALGFGFSILVLGYSFGHVSGGHFNPAVTIALTVFRKFEIGQAIIYIIAQILGGLSGVGLLKLVVPPIWNTSFGLNVLHEDIALFQGLILEIVGTAALTMVVFATAVDERFDVPRGKASFLAIWPISLTVFLAHILLIPFTGCGINPARSFASAVVVGDFTNHWIYWVGPIVGGLLGASFAFLTNIAFYPKPEGERYHRVPANNSVLEPLLTE